MAAAVLGFRSPVLIASSGFIKLTLYSPGEFSSSPGTKLSFQSVKNLLSLLVYSSVPPKSASALSIPSTVKFSTFWLNAPYSCAIASTTADGSDSMLLLNLCSTWAPTATASIPFFLSPSIRKMSALPCNCCEYSSDLGANIKSVPGALRVAIKFLPFCPKTLSL